MIKRMIGGGGVGGGGERGKQSGKGMAEKN